MDKTAQKRSILNQLREKINMPGAYLEGFFKPELDRVMTALKKLDDNIRAVLTGRKIGEADPPEDGVSAKDLLKTAKTNFNRREYIAGIVDLGHFHKKMWDVTQEIGKFFVDVDKIHHKFLFEGLPESYRTNLQSLREHMEKKKADISVEYFIKEAGIMDFFHNIGTKRGRSLAAWEKKYPKKTKELREWGTHLIDDAQRLLDNTISCLKQMATARAIRRPDDYMDVANKIKAEFAKFDGGEKGFRAYYDKAVTPLLREKEAIEKAQASEAQKTEPSAPAPGQIELGSPSVAPAPAVVAPVPPQGSYIAPQSSLWARPTTSVAPVVGPPGVPETQQMEPQTAPAKPAPEPAKSGHKTDKDPPKKSHSNFFESLESLGNEDPRILAGYITKYACSIQETDPETAIKLFDIAKRIRG